MEVLGIEPRTSCMLSMGSTSELYPMHDKLGKHTKKQRHLFANKGPYSHSYGFSSNYIWMWELDHKEGWAMKNWCFWTAVLEKTLVNSLDCRDIKPVSPKWNQPWIFIGRIRWNSNTLAKWGKEPTQWKRPWCWERLTAGGERDDREWDG